MIKMRTLLLFLAISFSTALTAQVSNFWSSTNENAIVLNAENDRGTIPSQYHTFAMDLESMKTYLQAAPMERTTAGRNQPLVLELPLPDGEIYKFNIVESPVMKPGIAARYSHIRSFSGYSQRDSKVHVRFVYSDLGFHAMFKTPNQQYFIQPYAKFVHDKYVVYNVKDMSLPDEAHFSCGVDNNADFLRTNDPLQGLTFNQEIQDQVQANARTTAVEAVEIVQYDMAMAGVAEWTANQGAGTVSDGMSSVNIAVNLLNSVLTPETAIRFVLIEDNDQLIYTDPMTDPYNDVQDGGGLLQQNQINLDATVGNATYDIGHVMTIGCSGGLGGIAGGSVCSDNGKGRGVTCQGGSLNGAILNIAVHEVAHQFTAGHTWNNCEGSILGGDILAQRASGSAYEPGSGTTIMSYSGSCQSQNIPGGGGADDLYYHVGSLDQMYVHSHDGGGSTCPDYITAANNLPELTLNYEDDFYIPISTPFELTAEATDSDNDDLTYCWEQYNLGPLSDLGSPIGSGPSFRSYPPTSSSTRVFPRLQVVIANSNTPVEVLPTYTRNLKFRCTVRDNNVEVGGVDWEEMSFEVTDAAGPFRVDYPNSNENFEVGDYVEILWDVANTDGSLVNCQKVNILLSNNGGFDYPFTLAEGVPNNGAHFVTIPDAIGGGTRIKVEAADNIFFDLSNFNSTIVAPSEPGYAFDAGPFSQQACAPDDIVFDINTLSLLDYDSLLTFSVTGLPAGANAVFSSNPVVPSEDLTLTIETDNVVDEGFYAIEIMAIAQGGDTLKRPVTIDVVLNDFSALIPMNPPNGASGISELPVIEWMGTPNATSYIVEIATNPSFAAGSLIETAVVTDNTFTPSLILEKNELYFWRIQAQNECGLGDFSAPQGFHTEVFECSVFSTDIVQNISGVGTPTVESTLVINTQGAINDLNITKLKGAHDLIRHLDVSLISPDETEVLLFSNLCGVATIFNMGLDDEAPLDIQCPPTTGATFKPQGSLSDFNGVEATGEWTLKIEVTDTDGTGGALEEWALQLCSNASANAPFLVTNELMAVLPGGSRIITNDFLLSDDADNTPDELTYTLVTAPENGTLYFLGTTPLEVGMTFRQSTINAYNLTYEHNGTGTTDGFTFAVEDGEGGWFGTPRFEIETDPDVIISTDELENTYDFSVFPNPAQNMLNLKFNGPVNEQVEVSVTNVHGQVLQSQRFDHINDQIAINTSNLTNGVFFVYVQSKTAKATKKFVIQK